MTTKEDSQTLVQYRCKMCNAPYPLGADDVISTCPYCGYTFVVEGGEMKTHLLLGNKLDTEGVRKTVSEWLGFASSKSVGKGVTKDIVLGDPMLQWIPTFRVKARADTYHFGAEQKGSSKNKYWVKVESKDTDQITEWVLARRHAATYGIQEFIESLEDSDAQAFDIKSTDQAPVLNSEIDEADAPVRARYQKAERDRSELEGEIDKLFDYRLDMDLTDCTYVHAPYWLVRYEYRGGTFRVAVSGATGEVVLGELPVTKSYRVKKWFSAIVLLLFSALLFQGSPYIIIAFLMSSSSDGDALMIPILMIVIGAVLWIGSFVMMGGVLKYEVQLTAEGEEREEGFSFTDSIKGLGAELK